MVRTVSSPGPMISARFSKILQTTVLSAKLTIMILLHSAMVRMQVSTVTLCGATLEQSALLRIKLFPPTQCLLLRESTSVIRLVVKTHNFSMVIAQVSLSSWYVKLRLLKPLLKLKLPLLPLEEQNLKPMLLKRKLEQKLL